MKRIKKVKQIGTVVPNNADILNEYSTSTKDVYACDYINNITDYNTTETVCGTYDGKPLYLKIFTGTTTQTNTVLLASDIAKVIDNKGFLMQDSQYALSFPIISGGTSYARIYTDTINHECYLQYSNDYKSKTYEITLEYTKTTD